MAKESRKKILFLANLPGKEPRSIGGTTLLSANIWRFWQTQNEFDVDFRQVRHRWKPPMQIVDYTGWLLKAPFVFWRYDAILIHAATDFTLTAGPLMIAWGKLLRKKVLYHLAGGSIHRILMDKPAWYRNWILFWLKLADALFVETHEMARFFCQRGIRRTVWLPNSRMDFPEFRPKPFRKRLAFISQVSPGKGVDILRKLMRELPGYTLDIYGPLSGYEEKDFDGLERIRYKGILPPADVIPLLHKNYDVLILPTLYDTEGYPGILIEAMAAGVPVITYRTGSIPEIIIHQQNGWLFEKGEIQPLVTTLRTLTPERHARMSAHAYRQARVFDGHINFRKYIDVLHYGAERLSACQQTQKE